MGCAQTHLCLPDASRLSQLPQLRHLPYPRGKRVSYYRDTRGCAAAEDRCESSAAHLAALNPHAIPPIAQAASGRGNHVVFECGAAKREAEVRLQVKGELNTLQEWIVILLAVDLREADRRPRMSRLPMSPPRTAQSGARQARRTLTSHPKVRGCTRGHPVGLRA